MSKYDSKSKLYKVWSEMKRRCNNPNDNVYEHYGGRGIRYCAEWEKFEPFKKWALANGYQEGERGQYTIDRIDVNGDYCPENCRWVSAAEQARNKKDTVKLVIDGIERNLNEWSELSGIPKDTILARYRNYGYTPKEAVFTPVGVRIHHKVSYNGEEMSLPEWSKKTGIPLKTLRRRIEIGWSVVDAVSTPVRCYRKMKEG